MKNRVFAILLLVLAACSAEDKTAPVPAPGQKTGIITKVEAKGEKPVVASSTASAPRGADAIAPWDGSACGDDDYQNEQMQRHPALMGRTADALRNAFGKPTSEERFIVGEPTGVFYGAYGRMPEGRDQKNTGDPMRVLTWTKNGCNFSVFFLETAGRSAAVHAFEWAVGSDF
jgi:hypothetical protein